MRENGRVKLPLGIQVHHGLVDGYHVSELVQGLERLLEKGKF